MLARIHVNQHVIRSNRETGAREPVITVKSARGNQYASEVVIRGPSKVVYRPDHPLPCGATVWIETESEVELWGVRLPPGRTACCGKSSSGAD